jgi:hypothetical protein
MREVNIAAKECGRLVKFTPKLVNKSDTIKHGDVQK